MFEFIRNHRRWMQLILLLLILPSFVLFGLEGYTSFMAKEPELASVDGQPITLGEFNRARTTQLEQYRSALGTQFDAAAFDTPIFREQLLNSLVDQRTVAAAANKGKYSVSDETLRRTIAAIPAVQQDGQFSSERYRQVLAAQGMTPASFELGLRRDLTIAQVLQPIGLTARVPTEVAKNILALVTEKRVVARQIFSAESFVKNIQISDADIKAWYEANQDQLRIPENVDVQFVVLNEEAATKDVKVSDADIESFYKQNQARYGQPERRRVSHILIEVPASADEATKARAKVRAEDVAKKAATSPKDFAALAKEFSQDSGSASQGGDLGWISKNMLVPQVEQAVFGLDVGKISGVIESPFGFHVLNVLELQPASVKPLADVKEDVAAEIRKQLAAERFADMAGKLTNLVYDQRDSLKPIADALNLKINTVKGLSRDGLLPAQQRDPSDMPSDAEQIIVGNAKVRQTVFSNDVLKEKLNSGVIELSPDVIVALRVEAVHPSRVPALDAVTARIRDVLIAERALAAAEVAGSKELDTLKADKPAEPTGFAPAMTVTRQSPEKLTREELEAVMSANAKTLPLFLGVKGSNQYSILMLTKVEEAVSPDPAQVSQLQAQLAQAWGAAEEQAALKILRQTYKVKVLPDAAKVISGELDAAKL